MERGAMDVNAENNGGGGGGGDGGKEAEKAAVEGRGDARENCGEEQDEERTKPDSAPLCKFRAPDGGWGWMVALGTFIVNTLYFSLPFCFGIMFSGFLVGNGASSTTIAWIYNLFLVVWNMSMILANPLCQEFGTRAVGFASVLMASIAITLSGFAPSIYFLYFSFSILAGLSTGLSVGIAFSVLPPYFDKKSGKANTFLVAGAPVTQMIFAPFLRYLLDEYSLQGATLIHGAILLNGLVAMSFFHPIKWHLKPCLSQEAPQTQQQGTLLGDKAFPQADSVAPGSTLRGVNRSVQRLRGSFSSSAWSVASGGSAEVSTGLAFLLDEAEEAPPSGVRLRGKKVSMMWRTLVRWRCVILAVTVALTQTTLLNFIMMLPFVAKAAHYSLQDAARCIALMGITNLVTRLVVSPLADCSMFSIRLSVMLGYVLRASGIAVAVVLSREVWQLMAAGVVYGLGLGFSLSMFNLSIVHYMGLDNLRPTIGILGLAGAVGFPTLGPLIGLIRDLTSNYAVSLCVMVGLDLVSAAVWLLMPAAQARDARRLRREACVISHVI
ncbi:monocarboxylate transporter 9-like [Portunus trituberculatus]|uniref:monocarboxylate transporter 9-like n=1 Tax=Portunus trituberculatus TaxID=210409 RepID=UPI001E1CD8EA|nr:monocarboxylate transporter 9-like [Portunus trituberculatus]